MGAVRCEACEQPQPRDWQPGQLCTQCGGAVRVDVRCAACTRWTPAQRFCRHCAAELVPAADYGAGRMLIQAGVDGLSLAQRVRELDPGQREAFRSRFATQRAIVERLCEEARYCAGFCGADAAVDALEDDLTASLPWRMDQADAMRPPALPKGTDAERLAALHEVGGTPTTRSLAAVALVRSGGDDPALVREVLSLLCHDAALAEVACLAIARIAPLARLDVARDELATWRAVTAGLFARRSAADEAALAHGVAVAFGRRAQDDVAEALAAASLVQPLRAALGSGEPLVRFGSALLLADEPTLATFVGGEDARCEEVAVRVLAQRQASGLRERLLTAKADELPPLLRWLRPPFDTAWHAALLALITRLAPEDRNRPLRLLLDQKWDATDPDAREAFARWIATAELTVAEARLAIAWAVQSDDRQRPYRTTEDVGAFADATARAFTSLGHAELRGIHEMECFLAVANRPVPRALLGRWLDDPEFAAWAAQELLDLLRRFGQEEDVRDERGIALFFACWEQLGAEARLRFAGVVAEVTHGRGGSSLTPWLHACWERFLQRADERPALWQATRGFRRELVALRDADPRSVAIDGGDPARRFAEYSAYDLRAAPELLVQLLEEFGDDERLASIGPDAFARAAALLEAGAHRLGLWLAATWHAGVVNRFRKTPGNPVWRAAAAALPEAHAQLLQVVAATTPDDPKDDVRGFHEHMATELRLAREVVEREEAEALRAAQRQAQQRERDEQQRQREEQRRRDEAERQAQAQRDQAAAAAAAAGSAARAEAAAQARLASVDPSALDDEVVHPDLPLRTLRDYAQLLRAMQAGGDVMALFAQRGMTVEQWTQCAQAWSTAMQRRMELALRFGQLLT